MARHPVYSVVYQLLDTSNEKLVNGQKNTRQTQQETLNIKQRPYRRRESRRPSAKANMEDLPHLRTWKRLVWTFSLFFGLNYLSCLVTLNVLGDPLWCLVVLSIYILVSVFHNSLYCFTTNGNAKGQLSVESLVAELKLVDIEKIPFVIERFLQLDKTRVGLKQEEEEICDSERCVVCLDERAAIQTLPCRHRVICGQCAWSTFKMALMKPALHTYTCVVCRGQIRDFNGSIFKNLMNLKWQDVKNVLDETKAL